MHTYKHSIFPIISKLTLVLIICEAKGTQKEKNTNAHDLLIYDFSFSL